MKLSYDLTLEQTQKLTMTPELIQAIRILQYNSQELTDYVQKEILENPVLDIDESSKNIDSLVKSEKGENETETSCEEDAEFIEKVKDADYDDISYKQWQYSKEDDKTSFEDFATKSETLEDNLLLQLTFSSLEGVEKKIGRYIIEALDDNGYLSLKIKDIAKIFDVDAEVAGKVLDTIQTFEPIGVGARSLEECLIIQLAAKGLLEDSVEYVILHHLKDIADNKLQFVAKSTGLTLNQVQMLRDLIKTLDPKPGKSFASEDTVKYIIPDVIIEKVGDSYQISSNESYLPKLVISDYYKDMAKDSSQEPDVAKYINNKYDSAQWLIKCIEQRKQTIQKVVNCIVKCQLDFFNYGNKYLKTLTMKQVADELGIHESTVSRSISGKYVETPRGVYELKYFFSSGVTNTDGDGISSNSIKELIKEIISQENPKHPYSDQDIEQLLGEKNIEISRRTVAKYRESMNILSSSKRRRL